jgi:hypothetical protein
VCLFALLAAAAVVALPTGHVLVQQSFLMIFLSAELLVYLIRLKTRPQQEVRSFLFASGSAAVGHFGFLTCVTSADSLRPPFGSSS